MNALTATASIILASMSALASSAFAQAVTVRAVPRQASVTLGGSLQVDLVADIAPGQSLVGWGCDVNYDATVLAHDQATGVQTGQVFFRVTSGDGDQLAGVVIPPNPPAQGNNVLLASLTFRGRSLGVATVTPSVTAGDPLEGFYGLSPFPLSTAFVGGSVEVVPGIWTNGPIDGVSALTVNAGVAEVADDLVLDPNEVYEFDAVSVVLAVSADNPEAELDVRADCSGRPGAVLETVLSSERIDIGPVPGVADMRYVQFVFAGSYESVAGGGRFWVSPRGVGAGHYFWPTSNSGHIAGRQAAFRSATLGQPTWTDVDQLTNFARCSDLNFTVSGIACSTIKDQSEYDLDGVFSLADANVQADGARAADNFQIPGAGRIVAIRSVTAWFATNCEPSRIFGEIRANDCDKPGAVLHELRTPQVFATGEVVDGLMIYRVSFTDLEGIDLPGGVNYWLAVAAQSGGSIHDRGYFLFRRVTPSCADISITEGVVLNPFAGVDSFLPVSQAGLAPQPRDFAFAVCGTTASCTSARADGPHVPGDVNRDGAVTFADISTVLVNFGLASEGH